MRQPIDLWPFVEAMGGVEALARLVRVRPPLAAAALPVVVVAQDHPAFGMRAQGGLGLRIGGIEIDMHPVCAQIEVMGGEIQNVAGGGLDRGDKAPCGGRGHVRSMRCGVVRRKGLRDVWLGWSGRGIYAPTRCAAQVNGSVRPIAPSRRVKMNVARKREAAISSGSVELARRCQYGGLADQHLLALYQTAAVQLH